MTSLFRSAVVFVTASFVLFGPAARANDKDVPEQVTTQRVTVGSEIFNNGPCVHCHAVAGHGTGRLAPNLSDAEWLHSEGDFKGILHTIFWGVQKDQFKALTPRKFEMNPKGNLNLDKEQIASLAAYVWTLSRPSTNKLVESQEHFIDLVNVGETDNAISFFNAWSKDSKQAPLLPEGGLTRLGYNFLPEHAQTAIKIFTLNAKLHADSWNAYDSLGEAYMDAGDRKRAIANYRKSLDINPDNENATRKLKELNQ